MDPIIIIIIRYDSLGGGSVSLKDYFCTIITFTVQIMWRHVLCMMTATFPLPQNKITRRHIPQNNHLNTHSRQKLKYDTVFTSFA